MSVKCARRNVFEAQKLIDIAGVNRSDNINLSIAANINGFDSLICHFRAALKPDRSAFLPWYQYTHTVIGRGCYFLFFPSFCIRREFWFRKQNSLFRYQISLRLAVRTARRALRNSLALETDITTEIATCTSSLDSFLYQDVTFQIAPFITAMNISFSNDR